MQIGHSLEHFLPSGATLMVRQCSYHSFMVSLNSIQINSSIVPHPSKFSTNTANKATCKWLTGIASQVLLMNCSLSVDWLYVKVMLQLLRTPGTTHGIQWYALKVAKKINQSLYQVKSNGVARILIMPKQYEALQHWNTWMLNNVFVDSLCIVPQIERSVR